MPPYFRNRDLPARFQLSGEKRFPGSLNDPLGSWIFKARDTLTLKSSTTSLPGDIAITICFGEGGRKVTSLAEFDGGPRLLDCSWDWIAYSCSPLEGLLVNTLCWIPDCRVACSSVQVSNPTAHQRQVILELACRLPASGPGSRIGPRRHDGNWIISGEHGGQTFLLSLLGDLQPTAAAASLETTLTLGPGEQSSLRWILATGNNPRSAEDLLRRTLHLDWAGEIARRKIARAGSLKIKTGNPDLDWALAHSQKQARLILESLSRGLEGHEDGPSCLSSLQAWLLCLALPQLSPRDMELLLDLCFSESSAGRTNAPLPTSTVIAGELLGELNLAGLDASRWKRHIPGLEQELQAWFSSQSDRDGDGIPELTGKNHFHILRGRPGDVDESHIPAGEARIEHPGLAALLAREIARLEEVEALPNHDRAQRKWPEIKRGLLDFIHGSWDGEKSQFNSRDSQTHLSSEGEFQVGILRDGWNPIRKSLPHPESLLLEYQAPSHGPDQGERMIILHGRDWQGRGRIEEITPSRIHWSAGKGWAVTDCAYEYLDFCLADGLGKEDTVTVKAASRDRQEISLLLPLWSPDFPERFLDDFISQTLDNPERYGARYGLRSVPEPGVRVVQLPWNILIARALLDVGREKLAIDLAYRWLEAQSVNLQTTGRAYPAWDDQTGLGWGKEDWIESLFPVRLFLRMHGVEFRTDGNLVIQPHPTPPREIRLSFREVEIILAGSQVTVIRPGNAPETHPRSAGINLQIPSSPSENPST